MLNPITACQWRRIGSRSPFFAASMMRFATELTHSVEMREVPKRTTSLIKRGSHRADLLVIKDKEQLLVRNDIHLHLP
jgi:hypothetical protein